MVICLHHLNSPNFTVFMSPLSAFFLFTGHFVRYFASQIPNQSRFWINKTTPTFSIYKELLFSCCITLAGLLCCIDLEFLYACLPQGPEQGWYKGNNSYRVPYNKTSVFPIRLTEFITTYWWVICSMFIVCCP